MVWISGNCTKPGDERASTELNSIDSLHACGETTAFSIHGIGFKLRAVIETVNDCSQRVAGKALLMKSIGCIETKQIHPVK